MKEFATDSTMINRVKQKERQRADKRASVEDKVNSLLEKDEGVSSAR